MSRVRFWPWPPYGRLPDRSEAEALPHIHPYLYRSPAKVVPLFPGPTLSGDSSNRQVPQAPVPCWGVTPAGMASPPARKGFPFPHRSYGRMRQSPSRRLPGAIHLGHAVFAGCCQSLLGVGPSRRSLCASFPACLALSPGGSGGARTRFFPPDFGLPHVRTGAALGSSSVQRLPHGGVLRGCSPSRMFKPTGLLATPGAPTTGYHVPWAAMAFPSEPLTVRYLPVPRIC